ncbi:acetylornithine deacetylase [Serinibacter arcticus]|uniref:Acetylornithine deacetylase n=1 Tax=Serinibacter arcticus TaxID=1655435 RepID=A0A2U1ZUK7_9MICO|nr:M20/M25/M40 family metallo-hydrolase [Serinibacter arcticus]PWD50677.1 acetylornithine deacetylase [Serinibacter arcticus]
MSDPASATPPAPDGDRAEAARLAERLARLVRIPTISPDDGPLDDAATAVFDAFREALGEMFPTTFAAADVETVGRAGLLLRIAGDTTTATTSGRTSPGATALGPVLLMAHQDVVPAPRGEKGEDWAASGWTHEPFAGVVAPDRNGDLIVHGRGTLDDKGAMLVTLEAVEELLGDGWRPAHDLHLLLGADEERDGPSAEAAVALLAERGVVPALVVDEGGAVATGAFPGLTRPLAVVGVAEKGVVNLEIVVESDPAHAGHASTPPRRGVVSALGRALAAIERHPHPAVVDDVVVAMFDAVAPHLPLPLRWVVGRADGLRRPLARVLPLLGGELGALVRTTATATVLRGSSAPNVIASRASAVVNLRVATTSSVADAVAHVERVVRSAVGRRGPRASVRVLAASEPTPVSPLDDERWALIAAAVGHAYPDAVVAPYTMLAASDSRFAARLTPAVYRFAPLAMTSEQRAGIHGVDEHVAADSLVRGVRFFRHLLAG